MPLQPNLPSVSTAHYDDACRSLPALPRQAKRTDYYDEEDAAATTSQSDGSPRGSLNHYNPEKSSLEMSDTSNAAHCKYSQDITRGAEHDAALADSAPIPSQGTLPADFPDGGIEAWTVLVGAWCALFVSYGWINAIGVFQTYYETNQLREYSSSAIAWIFSIQSFMMAIGGPAIGKIFDNYGPRYALLIGSLLHVFGLMMTSLSTQYYQFFLAQGICSALGSSAIFYSAMSCVSTWFHRRRAMAFGIMESGASLGGVLFPIIFTQLVSKIGFGWTLRTCAFIVLALTVVANLTPMREGPYVLLFVGMFFFTFGWLIPFQYLPLQGQYNGLSSDLSIYLISILNAASTFGRIIPPMVADYVGRFNTTIAFCAAAAVSVLALWVPSGGPAAIITFAAIYGFLSGTFVSMGPALIAQISDIREIGVRTGMMFALASIAGLIGAPIAGALIARDNGGFLYAQIFCGVVLTVGTAGFLACRTYQCGWKWKII